MSGKATVGSREAKTQLPSLLDRVVKGESIEITRSGIPIALLVPTHIEVNLSIHEAIDRLRLIRKGKTLGQSSIQELIDEGRQ